MKNLVKIGIIGMAIIGASCTKDAFDLVDQSNTMTFHAVSDLETRTEYADGDDSHVLWSVGDAISITDGSNVRKFVSDNTVASASANFNGGTLIDGATYYALYPFSDDAEFSGTGTVTTTLPPVQTAKAGSLPAGANLSVAYSTDTDLHFKNVGSIIRFSLTGDEVTNLERVVFSGNNNEDLTGKITIGISDEPKVTFEESKTQVTLNGPFTSGVNYYIVVAPAALTKGFTFRMIKADGTTYKKSGATANGLTLKRSTVYKFGEIDLGSCQTSYTYDRVTEAHPGEGEYILAYPIGEGQYKIFSVDKFVAGVEGLGEPPLTALAGTSDDYRKTRYNYIKTIFKKNYDTMAGSDDLITIDDNSHGKTVVSSSSNGYTCTIQSSDGTIHMTAQNLVIAPNDNLATFATGDFNYDDVYDLAIYIIEKKPEAWKVAIAKAGLASNLNSVYGGVVDFTAGYSSSLDGFAFTDKYLYKLDDEVNTDSQLSEIYLYRRNYTE